MRCPDVVADVFVQGGGGGIARLGGQMADHLCVANHALGVAGGEIVIDDLDAQFRQVLGVHFLQAAVVVVGEAVDGRHRMAAARQPLGDVVSDKSRGSGDDDAHSDETRYLKNVMCAKGRA